MDDNHEPGDCYWSLVDPIWGKIHIYAGGDEFLRDFNQVPEEAGNLFAAHWCQSEVRNGGLHQFFGNSTGVLAPEALIAFRAIGLNEWAEILKEAMKFFGPTYPRDHGERNRFLNAIPYEPGDRREKWDPFFTLDERFYKWLQDDEEGDRWAKVADAYAAQFISGGASSI